jgi:Domain of unknown function (DUF4382)/Domain of unknown function (DUF5666)
MKRPLLYLLLLALVATFGCGGSGNSNNSNSNSQQGSVFVTGEDAPLSSVVSFLVTINSATLNAQDGTTATVISTPTTVDFARLVGLRSPLAFNSVPAKTYLSATFVLANPVVDYITLNPTPAVSTVNGTFPGSQNPYSVTVNFPSSMTVGANGLAGLRMEMDIRDSLATDGNGNLVITNNTIAVTPVIYAKATKASDPDGQITDLTGGLASVNSSNSSFVIQGPYGRQLTVDVNNSTSFNSGWSINNLATPAIVGVEGYFQADGSLMATNVEVITTSHSFISGHVLAVTPTTGAVQSVTMWVGETGADMVSDVDTIMTVDISAVTNFEICFMDGPIENALFNDQSLVVGQRILIGGSFSNSVFTPELVSLRRQGVYGTFVPGTVQIANGNLGSFEMSNNGLVGYSVGGPLTVNTFNFTNFYSLTGLSQLETTTTDIPLVTRGLFLDVNGSLEFYAGWVADPPLPNSQSN